MEILKYFCNMNIKNKINNMDDAKREKLGEVIRFGIVGGLATVLQYVIYLAMMPALAHFIPNMGDHSLATTANTIAYIVSFIFNFIASTRYTFKVKARQHRSSRVSLQRLNLQSRKIRNLRRLTLTVCLVK